MDKSQVNIYVGHLGITRDNPDFYALLVLDTTTWQQPRIHVAHTAILRDEQGLAYSVSNITSSGKFGPRAFLCIHRKSL